LKVKFGAYLADVGIVRRFLVKEGAEMTVSFTLWDAQTIMLYHQVILESGIAETTEELHPGESFYGVTFEQFKSDTSGFMELSDRRRVSR